MKHVLLSVVGLVSASILTLGTAQAQQAVTVPSGTAMRVRTLDSIDASSARAGNRLRGTLADPLMGSNGAVLIPRGAPVQLSVVNVSRAGTLRGRDRIDLKVDSVTLNGRTLPVATTVSESRGNRRGNRTLRGTGIGAGAGAAIGAIAGGGTGAAVGALVGGAGGTAVTASTGRSRLRVPAETVLSFQLQAPLRVQ